MRDGASKHLPATIGRFLERTLPNAEKACQDVNELKACSNEFKFQFWGGPSVLGECTCGRPPSNAPRAPIAFWGIDLTTPAGLDRTMVAPNGCPPPSVNTGPSACRAHVAMQGGVHHQRLAMSPVDAHPTGQGPPVAFSCVALTTPAGPVTCLRVQMAAHRCQSMPEARCSRAPSAPNPRFIHSAYVQRTGTDVQSFTQLHRHQPTRPSESHIQIVR